MTKTTESKWRDLIADQARSGMTVREFAERRGINPSTLYWWRSRLCQPVAADLVPVEIVEREVVVHDRTVHTAAFELHLGESTTLSIPAGFDEAELRRLVRALRC
jgi:hypothetical protein